jgi:dolichol kinase
VRHLGRKLYHLGGGLGLLWLYFLLGRTEALWTYTVIAGVVLVIEIVRLSAPPFNRFLMRRFGSFFRKSEERRLTGTVPYILGIALSLLFYRTDIATAAICFLAFGDVAATTVGERFGRTKISGEKSLEGTAAFIAATMTAGSLLPLVSVPVPQILVVAGALVAAGIELLPLPLNDNLAIPLASGGAMTLLARLANIA